MSIRSLAAIMSSAACLLASPSLAVAQDIAPPLPQVEAGYDEQGFEGEWDGEWVSDDRYEGEWRGTYDAAYQDSDGAYHDGAYYDDDRYEDTYYNGDARDAWLDDCRRRYRDSNVEGAIIGGVLGGFAGNRIAGRGNRTVGTVAGAAIGAIAGAAIDDAERGRADECEAYLDSYMARGAGSYGYGYPAQYGYGQQAACACDRYTTAIRMVPVTTYRFGRVEAREEEIEEIIEETVIVEDVRYETIREPAAPAPRREPSKRIRYRK